MSSDDAKSPDAPRPDRPSPPPVLTGQQKQWLRGQAHALGPMVQVGQKGLTDAVVAEVDAALLKRELLKVRLHEPEDKKEMAEALAVRTGAALCGLVGHTVILYRPHPDEPELELPAR